MPDPLLRVKGLTKTYHVGPVKVEALKDVSFDLSGGRSLAVTGYSGSGKSTLLGLIGGLDRPTAGDVVFDGISYARASEPKLAALRRTRIGFVFQSFNLLPVLTAFENVYLAGRLAGLPAAEAGGRGNSLLAELGLSHRLKHRPPLLSAGEQQRVAIARALVVHPSLLLADEPTGDLDSENGAVVADLLFGLCKNQGATCIVATHNLELAARADDHLTLKDGSILQRSWAC